MTFPAFSFTTWAGLAASAAFIGSFWRQLVEVLKRFCDLFICRVAIKEETARAFMIYAFQHGKKSPFGLRLFGGVGSYVQPKKRVEIVAYEGVTSDSLLFWFGRIPILVGVGFSNTGNEPSIGHQASEASPVFIRYLRGTLNIDLLIEEAVTAFNQKRQHLGQHKTVKRFNVIRLHGVSGHQETAAKKDDGPRAHRSSASDTVQQLQRGELRLLTWKPEELTERSSDQPPFDLYPFGPEPLSILPEIDTWLKHEMWFRAKGVPYRRGYLLHSAPGCGKSTFVRSVAIKFDLPLYVFDLATMDNESFVSNWKTVQQNGPAIALLEDLDTIYRGREFVAAISAKRDSLTFDCLLNTISGVGSSDGILLFVTTNHVESIDPALGVPNAQGRSTRPGRIDRTIHFGPMEEPQRLELARFILSDFPAEIDRIVAEGAGETAAQFQERCARFAEASFWTKGVAGEIEPPPARTLSPEDQEVRAAWAKEQALREIFNEDP